LDYFVPVIRVSRPLEKWMQQRRERHRMVSVYTSSHPFDPETELKNFQREQAKYEAAYRRTGEPLALYEAFLHARAALQLPSELDWLVNAVRDMAMRNRTDQIAERFRERMRHVQRYRCVRDLRRSHNKDAALNLAVAALEAKNEAAARPTIEDSYDRVARDLKQNGRESEYFYLVARSDPTLIPVTEAQIAHLRRSGSSTATGGDHSGNNQEG
jgi:hypothetical protein